MVKRETEAVKDVHVEYGRERDGGKAETARLLYTRTQEADAGSDTCDAHSNDAHLPTVSRIPILNPTMTASNNIWYFWS